MNYNRLNLKETIWIGDSKTKLKEFPESVQADYRTDTYRAVYAVKIGERVYILHCFQKKSRRGIKTSKRDVALIKRRLRLALELEAIYEQEN